VPLPDEYKKLPFRQLYEVYRASASCGVPVSSLSSCLKQVYEDYSRLWAALNSAVSNVKDTPLPERSSLAAWGKAAEDFKGVGLAGRLKFLEQPSGPVFELSLHPLKLESSYRLAGKFGHDRFCVILLPSLGPESLPPYLKCIQVAARTITIKWLVETEHHFLGRCWRAYYVKPESARKSQKGTKSNSDARYRVNLFAEDGVDFRDKSARGELDPRKPTHSRMTVKELIEWHMSSKINSYQPVLKFFARIGLGLYPEA